MGEYNEIKTPTGDGSSPAEPVKVAASSKVLAVRLVIALMVAVFIFGNIATWAPMYELELQYTIMGWWNGYPSMQGDTASAMASHSMIMDTDIGRNISVSGHTEMVRPTFLLIFCIFPFLVSVLLVEYLSYINKARRLTATFVWRVAAIFRRKLVYPFNLGVSRFTIGEWCVGVLYVLGGNILCFWFEWDRRIKAAKESNILTTTKYWNIIGISTAYLCIYNMAFLLLPVTHNSAWMEFFNVSYANGVKFHRWIGFMTVITGEIHMIGYWVKWVRDGTWMQNQLPCFNCDFTDNTIPGGGYYAWFNVFGFISDLALLLIIPTSIPLVRRYAYEWFYLSHWVLFVVAVFFAILHWAQIIWWILPAGLVWFVSRAASNWNAFRPVQVEEFCLVGEPGIDQLVKLVVKRAAPGTSPMSTDYDFKVGNFVYINVPHVSKLQWHPLTIASSPKSSVTDVTLLVKALGDWSQELAHYAKLCSESNEAPVVYLDGFYGASLESYEEYPSVTLVGGGIGVTPLLSILEDVAAKVSRRHSWTQRVELIFTCREVGLLQVLGPVVAKLRSLDPEGKFFSSHMFITRALSDNVQKLELTRVERGADKLKTSSPKTSKVAATPFYEPLRSSIGFRAVLLFALFVIACFVVAAVRWGNGVIQGDNHYELWPLERAFELGMFCLTIVVVFAGIWYEHWAFQRRQQTSSDDDAGTNSTTSGPEDDVESAFWADIRTVDELLSHLNVSVGERPDVAAILANVLEQSKQSGSSDGVFGNTIGVFVSGPEGLKDATNAAVSKLGAGHFDVHEEEFEL